MLKQTAAVIRMSLENLGSRAAPSATVVVGSAAVVAVLLSLLAMSAGFRSALVDTAKPDRGLILRNGSSNEMDAWIGLQELAILEAYDGLDVTSGEVYTTLTVPKHGAGTAVDVVCRGVTAAAFALRPEVRIVSGRTLAPGRNEIIVGVSAARLYAGLDVGDRVQARSATLEVVGHFSAEGAAAESEIWMDRAIAQSVFRRASAVSVARVKLAPDVDAQALNQRLAADPRLTGMLIPEQEFFAALSASRAALIDAFAYLIAGIMALGSVFGALATMFTAVSRRSVEIATLRALGFHAVPVVVSVLVEATVLALAGGILGAAVVYAVLDGYTASTLNPAAGSQLAFAFRVTPESIGLGLGWAIAVGVIGGMAPAIRAARLPITTVLRGA